ncbi:hypothetical protein NOS3756_46020 [Nostoc sp. NIES-3756]|nr:hypothetical protein NOS3756_46020 [Nostoc sp. NIES-3756]
MEPEFIEVDGYSILLPVDKSHHPNIGILQSIWSVDHNSVPLFLSDTYEYGPFFLDLWQYAIAPKMRNFF